MKICKPHMISPQIGKTQLVADKRICLPHMISPKIGQSGVVITYGDYGAITYGTSGKIIY